MVRSSAGAKGDLHFVNCYVFRHDLMAGSEIWTGQGFVDKV